MTFIETRNLTDKGMLTLTWEHFREIWSYLYVPNMSVFAFLALVLAAIIIRAVIRKTFDKDTRYGILICLTAGLSPIIIISGMAMASTLGLHVQSITDQHIYEGYYMAEGNITDTHPPESLDYGAYQSGDFTEVTLDDGAQIILKTGDADLEAGMHIRAVTQPDTFIDPPYKLTDTVKGDHFEILESEQSK